MGDKSPKSKQRSDKQKKENATREAANAKTKQEKLGGAAKPKK